MHELKRVQCRLSIQGIRIALLTMFVDVNSGSAVPAQLEFMDENKKVKSKSDTRRLQ